jgi:nitroreductase
MDAITLLHGRNSAPRLTEPAPSSEILDDMFKAAFRAPDHARLRPWRFLTIEGESRNQLGDVFANAAQLRNAANNGPSLTEGELDKIRSKALRAPLIIAVIACVQEHPKVPEIEQIISAGCAAQNILLAAHAHGFAGVWRTGANAFDREVMNQLGLSAHEQLVGFLYLGTIEGKYKPLAELQVEDYCQPWPSNI